MKPTLFELIDQILRETDYASNPYFVTLARGDFSKADFVETQIQFSHAVTYFSRPMAALVAKIPEPELRVEILRNLWEEHGEGNLSRTHKNTFAEFLRRLDGISEEQVSERALWPEVRLFNTALSGACLHDEYLVGAAMLGMIERMFCDISAWIGKSVIERGWIPRERMVHYELHEVLDVKHSDDFFALLEPAWERSAEDRYFIEQGLRLGATAFNGMYEGLYRARARRLQREFRGPHSRA